MDCISTGLAQVDGILGGGLPRGCIVEVFGCPSSGKSTVALNWVAAAQRGGLTPVWVDADRTFDVRWAARSGVQTEELVVARPSCGWQAVGILDHLLRTFSVDLIVVDSASALQETDDTELQPEDVALDASSGFLGRMLRRCRGILDRSRAVIVFLSPQYLRDQSDETGYTPGGRILTQYAAIRLAVRSRSSVLHQGVCAGQRLSLLTIKNRFSEPYQEVCVDLDGPVLKAPLRMPAARVLPDWNRGSQAV